MHNLSFLKKKKNAIIVKYFIFKERVVQCSKCKNSTSSDDWIQEIVIENLNMCFSCGNNLDEKNLIKLLENTFVHLAYNLDKILKEHIDVFYTIFHAQKKFQEYLVQKYPSLTISRVAMQEEREKYFGEGFSALLNKVVLLENQAQSETMSHLVSLYLTKCSQINPNNGEIEEAHSIGISYGKNILQKMYHSSILKNENIDIDKNNLKEKLWNSHLDFISAIREVSVDWIKPIKNHMFDLDEREELGRIIFCGAQIVSYTGGTLLGLSLSLS